jgi:glutathione S-transferase
LRLHHQPGTRSTRVLWLLEEIGAPFDLTLISRADKAAPAYRRLHPLGRSPVVEDDEGPIFESAAISLHLADCHPDAGLIAPLGSHARALQYQWSFFAMTELESALLAISRARPQEGVGGDPGAQSAAVERFAAAAEVVAAALADGEFLVGGAFSVADVVLGSVLAFAGRFPEVGLPAALAAYVERLDARPARQRAQAVAAPGT